MSFAIGEDLILEEWEVAEGLTVGREEGGGEDARTGECKFFGIVPPGSTQLLKNRKGAYVKGLAGIVPHFDDGRILVPFDLLRSASSGGGKRKRRKSKRRRSGRRRTKRRRSGRRRTKRRRSGRRRTKRRRSRRR